MTIVTMSLIASVPILIIVILRSIGANKLPKRIFVILWGIVLCRLLIPFTVPTNLTIEQTLVPFSDSIGTANTIQRTINQLASSSQVSEQATTSSGIFALISPVFVIWLILAVLIFGFFIMTHLRSLETYKMALPIENPKLKQWLGEQKMIRNVQLRQSDQISSPLTYGIFRPVILLPKTMADTDMSQVIHVMTHELIHIKRFDLVFKWFLIIALSIHWFNPLVWVMYVLANRDLEMSCDETVIKKFGKNSTSAYALTLIQLTELTSKWTPLHSHFSKHSIEERIVSVMQKNKSNIFRIILSFILVLGPIILFSITPIQADSVNLFEQVETVDEFYDYDDFLVINSPYDRVTMATSNQDELFIRYTAFTDHYVYAVIGIEGPIIDGVEVEAIAVDPYIEEQLFGISGQLKELEPDRSTRYFLYAGKITDLDAASGVQQFFSDDTDFLKSASLRNHHKRSIDFIFSLNGSEYPLSTMIENVTEKAYTFQLNPDIHGEGFYDQAVLISRGLSLTGSKSEFEDEWEAPDISITIVRQQGEPLQLNFDSMGMLFHDEFTASLSDGYDSQSNEFYSDINIDFERSELDLADIEALIINGVTYQLND